MLIFSILVNMSTEEFWISIAENIIK